MAARHLLRLKTRYNLYFLNFIYLKLIFIYIFELYRYDNIKKIFLKNNFNIFLIKKYFKLQ